MDRIIDIRPTKDKIAEIEENYAMQIKKELRCDFCRFFREKTYGKKHNPRKRYCLHYGKRLRKLICIKQCPFFSHLKPRKDGHIWKTFTELDLETIIWK